MGVFIDDLPLPEEVYAVITTVSYNLNRKKVMRPKLTKIRRLLVPLALLFASVGCSHREPCIKLKRASFNRCIYQVEERNVCWDVRAFVDDGNHSKGEEFIISLNLVMEDYDNMGPSERIFKVKKLRVYFGDKMVYQGKRFDHHDWLGPSMGSSSNMLRLNKKKMGEGDLSVIVWTEDDLGRTYQCEAGQVKVGDI